MQSLMYQEAAASADMVDRQFIAYSRMAERIKSCFRNGGEPKFLLTCARGSSDHAATYAKYVFESYLKTPTISSAPSSTIQNAANWPLNAAVFMAISQSGCGPDIVESARAAKLGGAKVIAITNTESSPLAEAAHLTLPLCAGLERSVAATKTFIASLYAILTIAAVISEDFSLRAALERAPALLRSAWRLNWEPLTLALRETGNVFVLGRGMGFATALETALKLKETTGIHAEAFSSSEVRHGPMAIVGSGFPVLAFTQNDRHREPIIGLVEEFRGRGALGLVARQDATEDWHLPLLRDVHPALEPLLSALAAYKAIEQLASLRGVNPDQPPYLSKIVETI